MKRFVLLLTLVASNASAQERCVIHYEGPIPVDRMRVTITSRSPLVRSVTIAAEGSESHCARGWCLASQAIDAEFLATVRAMERPSPCPPPRPEGTPYRITWRDSWVVFIVDLPEGGMRAFYIPWEYKRMTQKPSVLYGYIETLRDGRRARHDTVNGVTSYDDPRRAADAAFSR